MNGPRLLATLAASLMTVGGVGYFALKGEPPTPDRNRKATFVKTDLEALQSTWQVDECELDGTKMAAAMVQASKIILKGNAFRTVSMGADYEGTFTLDPGASPKTIDMAFTTGPEKGNTTKGIYKLDGDVWTLCLATTAKTRPTKFATAGGSGLALETLKRSTGDDPKPAAQPPAAPPTERRTPPNSNDSPESGR